MNVTDALKLMVRHYPGGLDVIAIRIDKAASTLEKELRGASGYKLGAADANAIAQLCVEADSPHCRAYMNAVAGECGGFIELEVRDGMRRQDLRVNLAEMVKECSDVLTEATGALADDRISDNERRRIEKEVADAIAALQSVHQAVRSVNAAGKPAALREVA